MEDQRDEIKQKIDIVDLINEYVPLKKEVQTILDFVHFIMKKLRLLL